jgi:hypothetical protein
MHGSTTENGELHSSFAWILTISEMSEEVGRSDTAGRFHHLGLVQASSTSNSQRSSIAAFDENLLCSTNCTEVVTMSDLVLMNQNACVRLRDQKNCDDG